MGAGCSNRNAVAVQDVIKTADINQLTKDAQEHLKAIKQAEGSTNLDQDKLIKSNKEEEDVKDKDISIDDPNRIKHQSLWDAVELNDAVKVISYLEEYEEKQGEELKETELYDRSGNSVLHKAASLGHANILMLLLERTGAKPDLVNSSFATPLHLAVKNNRVDAAKFLIGCGVDANCQDEHGQGPLLICSIHGHYELTRMLIEASTSGLLPDPIEVDIKDHRGLSPLNCAAIKGDFDLVKLLVINGASSLDQTSPKGCTPLLYAARGGYSEVVRFLILRGASALRQDNAGGTVLHHAIEKGHIEVLHILQEFGVDVHSAIEIPDNAGRTPIFEAVDNHETSEIITLLTSDRKKGGFDAKVNIMNYNGQTPLFSACREGNLEVVKTLVEECGAKLDMTQGELFKEDLDDNDNTYESMQEKFFMDAYKNCMTPLQVATVLGYESIMHYLIEKGSNPNLQTKIKGYSCLHLAVLANKPEIVIELLTKTQANPYLPDFGGRTLQDMIEIFIPSYLDSFKQLLENLQYIKQKGLQEADSTTGNQESLAGLVSGGNEKEAASTVATHYYNPDDERSIQGVGADEAKINDLYSKKAADESEQDKQKEAATGQEDQDKKNAYVNFHFMDDADIKIETDALIDAKIEEVFGRKVALAMNAIDWKFKEIGMKVIYKFTEKYLDVQNQQEQTVTIDDLTQACASAVSYTCKEKVIKVFMISLQLLNLLVSSTKIEKTGTTQVLKNTIVEKNVVLKLLQKTEEGNTRITNKIHESLLDLSFNPEVGEALTSSFILQRIQAHNRANAQKQAQKNAAGEGVKSSKQAEQIETEASLGSYKGLLAQLALLYKFINSFGIASRTRGPLSVKDVLKSIMPAIQHPNQDVRNASGKILMDVHKLSGCVTEEDLETLGDKAKTVLLAKINKIEVEKNLMDSHSRAQRNDDNSVEAIKEEDEGEQTDRAEVPETISTSASPKKSEIIAAAFSEKRAIIEEKGNSKEWTERELALKAVEEVFTPPKSVKQQIPDKDLLEQNFLQNCLILLKTCFEENNMTIYLQAVQVGSLFFGKSLVSEVVQGSLQSLIQPIILRTNDTNTRIRKKSVELIYQIWDFKGHIGSEKLKFGAIRDSQDHNDGNSRAQPICQVIAQVICDSQLGEKSIIGRLGLFIRRAQQIEGGKDLAQKPLAMLLGKNYEQLTEFACQWVAHKNTKVRQNALKLITEICRINCLDPRGTPFKQRIVNFILGLRSTQRDPLVVKINEICLKNIVANTSPGRAGTLEPYINVNELDLGVSSKTRAASMDHMTAKRRLQSASRGSKRGGKDANAQSSALLPTIGAGKPAPASGGVGLQPTIVLPHSEALTAQQKATYVNLIDLFGEPMITCFLSKSWSTRQTTIQKIQEQLPNLDPSRRDAMSAEINTKNLPIELNFKTFIEMIVEGLKDPVLKNFLLLLELTQTALPIFFRYIQPHAIRNEVRVIVIEILKKTADMKQKVREAAINFCLYLSHQSPVGPEFMVEQVLMELDRVQNETKDNSANQDQQASTSYGNSHMITSCLGLLNEYQTQTQILSPERDTPTLLKKFMDQVNAGLKHSNPQVRKEAEKLFKTLYPDFGQSLEDMLQDQKPALQQKLLKQAKIDVVSKHNMKSSSFSNASGNPSKVAQDITDEQKVDTNVQRAQDRIRDQVIEQSQLKVILEGAEEHLQALKLPNPRKRQKAIVEIKKAVSKRIVGAELTQQSARDLFEPLTMLMRQLLQDDHPDIYLESLNLLKFIVGSLAPYLSTLDLHLMMGSFIGIIVQNTVSGNMRIQVSSDKVIVFFAKHQNIGPCIVAKEVTKNIDKINKAVNAAVPNRQQVLNEKQQTLLRFFGILKLLLQQFSIILCYQQDFYIQCLECIADSMNLCSTKAGQAEGGEDVAIKSVCAQIVYNLYAIDYKLLDTSVGGLSDLNRKTPLKKAIIEYETQQKQGKGYIDVNSQDSSLIVHGGGIGVSPSPLNQSMDKMRDTQMSFASSTNRQSLFSPGSTMTRGQSPGGFGASQYDGNWGGRFKLDPPESESRKTIDARPTRGGRLMSLGEKRNPGTNQSSNESYLANHPISHMTQSNWRREQDILPVLDGGNLNRTGVLLPNISNSGLGVGAGLAPSYTFESRQPAASEANSRKPALKAHKLKSSQGAGFSSQNNAVEASYSQNEPKREQNRTPRRTLGVLVNNNMGGNSNEVASSSAGLGAPGKISWPSQAGKSVKQMDNTDQGARMGQRGGGIPTSGGVKPPLYVPSRRQPSENGRTVPQPQQPTNSSAYVPKTGFSSSIGGSSPSGHPPKARRPSFSNNEGGYVPSAMNDPSKRR